MSENGWTTAHLSEIDPFPTRGDVQEAWRPVRHRLGVSAFGVNAWVAREGGQQIIEEHDEVNGGADDHQELYYVSEGHATFTVGGDEIDAPAGTFVFVEDPALVRKAVAHDQGTTILAIGATPGVAYTVSPWEQRHIDAAER